MVVPPTQPPPSTSPPTPAFPSPPSPGKFEGKMVEMNYGATMASMFIPEGSRTSAYMPACFKFRVPHHSQPTTPTPPSPPPDLLAWEEMEWKMGEMDLVAAQ